MDSAKKIHPMYIYSQLVLDKISVIVPCYNNEQTLASCLDSILVQAQSIDFEIILVDDASTDDTQEVIQQYIKQFPNIIRSIRFSEHKGTGQACNAGMGMAKGEFIAFVYSDDSTDPDFLIRALAIMQKEHADIVAFDTLTIYQKPTRTERRGIKPGTYSHEQSLEQCILRNIETCLTSGHLYRTNMLMKAGVSYGTAQGHEDIIFAVAAFYHSAKTVVCDTIGYYRHIRPHSLSASKDSAKYLEAFFETTAFMESFFTKHNLDTNSETYCSFIKHLYTANRTFILAAVHAAKASGTLYELLTKKQLMNFGASAEVLRLIIRDFAQCAYYQTEPRPTVAFNNLDWRKDAAASWPEAICLPYADADTPSTPAPLLSVIIPNYNKENYFDASLESILTQTTDEIEILIIDDNSTDNSYMRLQAYADKYPAIRLFRMEKNCRQGVCRNIGIEKARGTYVTFVDSDDVLCPTFFANGIKAMQESDAELFISAVDTVTEDDRLVYRASTLDGTFTNTDALFAYIEGKFAPAPHGKLYKRLFLITHKIEYPFHAPSEDQVFLMNALERASTCSFSNTVYYKNILSKDSSMRTATYSWMYVHASCTFYKKYASLEKYMPSFEDMQLKNANKMPYDIQNIFIPVCGAFLLETGELPLTPEDFKILQNSPLFLQALLSCFAQKTKEIDFNTLPALSREAKAIPYYNTNHIEYKPLISIIIPVYNQDQYLSRCLDSILEQPLQNFEVLLVDDASTDFTPQICANYAAKDRRFRVFTNSKNSRQGYSRNFAMDKSRAPYVTFVDSDDYIESCLLPHGVQILHNMPHVDIVHFNNLDKTEGSNATKLIKIPQSLRTGISVFEDFCHRKIPSFAPWGKVYRKSYLEEHHVLSPEYMWEDNFFTLKAFYHARNIYFTGQHGYTRIFTPHEASTVTPLRLTPKHINGLCNLAYDLEQFSRSLHDEKHKNCVETLSRSFANFRFKTFLPYMQSCIENDVFPINQETLHNLANSSAFVTQILENFAELHAKHTAYKAALPPEDFVSCEKSAWLTPAKELITLLDRTESTSQEIVDISVIVPAFNVGTTLARCLDSILIQKARFEIILVEDNSTSDNTLEVCFDYARKYNCIRLFQTPRNSGLGSVRNLAMQKACGTYITHVDSDDWIEPTFFQRALLDAKKHFDVDILLYRVCSHFEKHKVLSTTPDKIVTGKEMLSDYINKTYKHYNSGSIFFKKEYLKKHAIKNESHFNEDELLLLTAYYHAHKILLSSTIGYHYKRYGKIPSIMRPLVRGKKHFESTVYNIKQTCTFFENNPNIDSNLIKKCMVNFVRTAHHRSNLLEYIQACKEVNLPSPLTADVLHILTHNKVFFTELLKEYILLSQKTEPHQAPAPSQKTIQRQDPAPTQKTAPCQKTIQGQKSAPCQNIQPNSNINHNKVIKSLEKECSDYKKKIDMLSKLIYEETYLTKFLMKYMLFLPYIFMPFIKKHAFTLFNISKFKKCEILVIDILKKVPNTAWAYYLLAKIHRESQEYQITMLYLNKAIEIEPNTDYFRVYKTHFEKKMHLYIKSQYKNLYNNTNKENSNLLYYNNLNILYTYIPKNACSTLKKTFAHASGIINLEGVDIHHVTNKQFKITKQDLCDININIIALRNPYKRLVSGYLDKIVKYNINEKFAFDLKEITFINQKNYSIDKAHKAVYEQRKSPTLYDFTKQIQKMLTSKTHVDEHFIPQKNFLHFNFYDIIFNIDDNLEKQWKNSKLATIPLFNSKDHATSLRKTYNFLENRNDFLSDIQGDEIRELIQKNENTYPSFTLFFEDEKMRKLFFEIYKEDIQLYCKFFGFTFIDNHNKCYENLCST